MYVRVQVNASKLAQALYPLVLAEEETGTNTGLSIGARALSAFRELYRHAWDEPRVSGTHIALEKRKRSKREKKRKRLYVGSWSTDRARVQSFYPQENYIFRVASLPPSLSPSLLWSGCTSKMRKLLANTSVIPSSAGAGDLLLPLLNNFPPGWFPLNATTAGKNKLSSRKRDTRGLRRKKAGRRRSRARRVKGVDCRREGEREGGGGGVARALSAVAAAALQASKEYQEALLGGAAIYGGDGGGRVGAVGIDGGGGGGGGDQYRGRNGMGTAKTPGASKGCRGPLPTFQRWGGVGVLNVPTASSQVDWASGRPGAGRRLLPTEAWAWLEDFFRAPEIGWQVLKTLQMFAEQFSIGHTVCPIHGLGLLQHMK